MPLRPPVTPHLDREDRLIGQKFAKVNPGHGGTGCPKYIATVFVPAVCGIIPHLAQ